MQTETPDSAMGNHAHIDERDHDSPALRAASARRTRSQAGALPHGDASPSGLIAFDEHGGSQIERPFDGISAFTG
ncbi:MAG: hypothetical protein EPN70_00210 [Paraburkholderia sp.]|uniref:hypothetical protein n=1 Tax=Paraburkholderia sp. TaxID=1926495 RepID=UPI00120E10C7|nr:hypothetical protein [Paraburkholderia sp.]TAM08486.1 MAG: hypothetical protein EPN70_00210 [Paraburkholderia sp.]TAM30225.1 MAG: hypothetical protein EPN59_10250 [Paraburkholderia sp.]